VSHRLTELKHDAIPSLLANIQTTAQWEEKREAIRSSWHRILGTPASLHAERPGNLSGSYEIVGETKERDHVRQDIRYQTYDGDTVPAFLLIPNQLPSDGKCPAVLALHPTTAEGRADVATPNGRENRMYGVELVSRGYVVLAPDSLTFGGRVYPEAEPFQTAPFYDRHPHWSMIGKMAADHMRALDLLCAMDVVDANRIGAIGHSLGGYNGWFLAAMDKRIRAVVSSCGFSMFTEDADPNRWGRRDWFSHAPVITDYLQNGLIPFEWHEIVALAAPVPMFMWSGIKDAIFPNWAAIAAGMADVDGLYRFLGAEERFQFAMGNAGHDFPPSMRETAYRFMDRWLKHTVR